MFSLIILKLDPPKVEERCGRKSYPEGFKKSIYAGLILDAIMATGLILGGKYGDLSGVSADALVTTGSLYIVMLVFGSPFVKMNYLHRYERYYI